MIIAMPFWYDSYGWFNEAWNIRDGWFDVIYLFAGITDGDENSLFSEQDYYQLELGEV